MIKPPAVIHSNEKMKSIIEKFEHSKAWNLPVVDRKQHYIGIISKSRIFTVYRNALIEHTEILLNHKLSCVANSISSHSNVLHIYW